MTPIQWVEHEVETTRLISERDQDPDVGTDACTKNIDYLKKSCRLSLMKIAEVQATRNCQYNVKVSLPKNILAGDWVLLYDNRYDKFPRKLQT
jgi:hypothetical protein